MNDVNAVIVTKSLLTMLTNAQTKPPAEVPTSGAVITYRMKRGYKTPTANNTIMNTIVSMVVQRQAPTIGRSGVTKICSSSEGK